MEKQKSQFVLILVVLAVLVAATVGLKIYNQKTEEKEEAEEEAATIYITQAVTDDITAFSYELDGETLSFTKDGDSWLYDGDTSADIDEDSVETLLAVFESLTASETVEDYDDLADYGLDAPADTVTFTTDSGTTTIYVGDENDILSEYYVKLADSDTIYLTSTSLQTKFSKSVEDLTAEEETETEEPEEATEAVETTETAESTEAVETTETALDAE